MKKLLLILVCLIFWVSSGLGVYALESESTGKLPVIVAQLCEQANTVTLWHDIDDDGKADYKATYVFKDGRLHQVDRSQMLRAEPVRQIQER